MQVQTQHATDEQILALCQHKATIDQGFRLLLAKYQERLYKHARHMLIDHEDTNDVLQNALIKVYRNLSKFERKSKLFTWLYRIVTNEAITFLNKQKRQLSESINSHESLLANQLKADSYFSGEEVQVQLQLALEKLPEKQRLVFNMRYFDELTYKEISSILGTSVGALKATYHHAVKKVERHFKEL